MLPASVDQDDSGPPDRQRPGGRGRVRRNGWTLAGLCAAALLIAAFSPSAFRIDEPNIIAIAEQIARSPLDPYGFRINWNGSLESAYTTLANPPLVPYWLALWGSVFGWSEIALHLSMIPFALLALVSFQTVTRSFSRMHGREALLMAASPAFVLASLVVMPDVAMLAFLLASLAAATLHAERDGIAWWLVAAICGFVTPLIKYNGLVLIPLLAFLGFALARNRRSVAALSLAPAGGILIWSLLGWARYGQPHLLAVGDLEGRAAVEGMTGTLAAVGIGVVPLVLCFGGARSRWPRSRVAGLTAAAVMLFSIGKFLYGYPLVPSILFGLSIAVALDLLRAAAEAAIGAWSSGRKVEVLAPIWILLVMMMQEGLLFTSVRYVLPLLPPALLLLVRERSRSRWFFPFLGANVALVIALAIGDVRIGNLERSAVQHSVVPRLLQSRGSFYFAGHWGLQYYAEKAGGELVTSPPSLEPGDVFLVSRNSFPGALRPTNGDQIETVALPGDPMWPLRTIDCGSAANFYGTAISGCRFFPLYLPWGFGEGDVEQLRLYRAVSAPIIASRLR